MLVVLLAELRVILAGLIVVPLAVSGKQLGVDNRKVTSDDFRARDLSFLDSLCSAVSFPNDKNKANETSVKITSFPNSRLHGP